MDFDAAWCPACERLIPPKRYIVQVPVLPPAPPSSPSRKVPRGGLVNGTGRHNKHVKPQMKQCLVIDNGPIPLYCSDACHIADIKACRKDVPQNPALEETASSSSGSSNASTLITPPQNDKPLTPRERFAKAYGITLPPPPPQCDDLENGEPPLDYTGGNMMAGKFIDSMCAIRSNKSEPAKVIPGWNDGSTAWRSAVYNYMPQSPSDPFYTHVHPSAASSSTDTRFRRSSRVSSSAPSAPPPLENEELIARFNDKFTMRCEARMAQLQSHSRSSTASSQPIKREGSILLPGAEGKLLVPDVKLKVRTGSNTSISSANATPMSPTSSRKSARSPLSRTSNSDSREEIRTSFTLKRPTIESSSSSLSVFHASLAISLFTARSWSYDNVKTYPIMELPPKKVKKLETQIIDGEECQVEVEVEVHEERKRLFLFAPKVIVR